MGNTSGLNFSLTGKNLLWCVSSISLGIFGAERTGSQSQQKACVTHDYAPEKGVRTNPTPFYQS